MKGMSMNWWVFCVGVGYGCKSNWIRLCRNMPEVVQNVEEVLSL